MSDISSWSPVDESNTTAPPNGWPEFMNPSDVNNCARAMMGAIRRNYDGLAAGTVALPYVKTTGDSTIAGNLTVNGGVTAAGQLWGGSLAIAGGGYIAGGLTTNNVHATNNITADVSLNTLDLEINQNTSIGSGLTAGAIHSTGNMAVDTDFTANTVTANYIHSNGNLDVTGSAAVAGSLNVTSAITANAVSAAGITGTATVNTNNYYLGGAGFASRGSDAAGSYNGIIDGVGSYAFIAYGYGGSYYRCDNAHSFTNRAANFNICRFQTGDGNTINISGYWNIVSEGSLKRDVQPYTVGLRALLALKPVSYVYTDESPFGAGQKGFGLIASEAESVMPEMVGRLGGTEHRTIAPGHLIWPVLNALREIETRLCRLEEMAHV